MNVIIVWTSNNVPSVNIFVDFKKKSIIWQNSALKGFYYKKTKYPKR